MQSKACIWSSVLSDGERPPYKQNIWREKIFNEQPMLDVKPSVIHQVGKHSMTPIRRSGKTENISRCLLQDTNRNQPKCNQSIYDYMRLVVVYD
jgi:hypothetical protein